MANLSTRISREENHVINRDNQLQECEIRVLMSPSLTNFAPYSQRVIINHMRHYINADIVTPIIKKRVNNNL